MPSPRTRGGSPCWLPWARWGLVHQLGVISFCLNSQLDLKQEPGLLFHLFTPFFFPSLLPCLYKPAVQEQVTFRHVLDLDVPMTRASLLPSAGSLLRRAALARSPRSPCGSRSSGAGFPERLEVAKPIFVLVGRG